MKKSHILHSLAFLVACSCNAVQKERPEFFVQEGTKLRHVQRGDVSPFLRSLNTQQLEKFAAVGNRIKISSFTNGDYRLSEQGELRAGGPGWATALAIVGYPAVGLAALGTLIVTAPSGPGCVAAAFAVAAGGCAAVTKAVIVVAVTPTP